MSLRTDLAVDASPDAVAFTLTVGNDGDDPVELTFQSGQDAEFVVYDAETEVWRWSSGRAFTQVIRTRELAPGETLSVEGSWQRPDPGEYRVEASLEAMTEARAAAEFSVE